MGLSFRGDRVPFLSDSPLTSFEDDRLGWDRLTDNIVKTIKFNVKEKGFVIGIKARWGTGKSTILNFIKEKLRDENEYVVFRYNPWLYPNENHVENFFTELAKIIKRERPDEETKRLIRVLRKYAAFSSLVEIPTRFFFRIVSLVVFSLVAITGVGGVIVQSMWWWYIGLAVVALFLLLLSFSKKFLGALERYYSTKHDLERKTLYELKQELNNEMSNTKKRVVVLVDDIDRLSPAEICNIFQLVKNNGDIENVTYVLAFDDDVVKEVLVKEYCEQYRFFTEKIVQIAFTLPNPEEAILARYFQNQLVEVFKELPKSFHERWEEERWTNYNYSYFRLFSSNFREVKRIINGIHLNIDLIFTNGTIEVNPVDYISIEIIRIHFPQVYDFIRNNSEIFVYRPHPTKIFGEEDGEKKDADERFSKCLENVNEHCRSALDDLLHDLFPSLARLTSKLSSGEDAEQEWVRDSRICAHTVFDRYFLYGNYTGDIPNHEVLDILTKISRPTEAVDMLKKYHFTNQLPFMLELILIKATDSIGKNVSPNDLVRFAFDISDYLPKDQGTAAEIPVRFVITNFVEKTLENYDFSHRANVLEDTLWDTSGIFGPLIVLAMIEPNEKEERKDFIDPGRLRALKKSAWDKGIKWLKQDSCLDHRHLSIILWVLKHWDTENKFNVELQLLIKEDKNFKLFLVHYLIKSETVKYGEIAGSVQYRYDFEELAKLVAIPEIYDRVMKIGILGDDSEQVKIALETFKRDYEGRRKGQSKQ